MRLKGKKIVLGATGSIAIIEVPKLIKELRNRGAEVIVTLTKSAQEFLTPKLLEFFSKNAVITEITGQAEHVKLLGTDGEADLLIIAPATLNTICKIGEGITDTCVTILASTAIGSGKPVIIAPAMSLALFNNPILVKKLEKLKKIGVEIVNPRIEGNKAKIAETERICLHVERAVYKHDLKDKKIVVTSGPTFEYIDSIRFLSNKSSGLMGRELALEAWRRGARVTHISSKPINLDLPNFKEIKIVSVKEMLDAVLSEIRNCNLFISAAAPLDFTIEDKIDKKLKSNEKVKIKLKVFPKIIKEVRKIYSGHIIGFKAEVGVGDEELYKIAINKMIDDKLEMVVANDVAEKGMGTVDSKVLILSKKSKTWCEGLKTYVAKKILDVYVKDYLCSSHQQV